MQTCEIQHLLNSDHCVNFSFCDIISICTVLCIWWPHISTLEDFKLINSKLIYHKALRLKIVAFHLYSSSKNINDGHVHSHHHGHGHEYDYERYMYYALEGYPLLNQ